MRSNPHTLPVSVRPPVPSHRFNIPYEAAYKSGFKDVRRRVPDTSKVRALLGFAPDSHLDDILNDVIAYFRAHPDMH